MFIEFVYVYNDDYCLFCKVNIICTSLKYGYNILSSVIDFRFSRCNLKRKEIVNKRSTIGVLIYSEFNLKPLNEHNTKLHEIRDLLIVFV